MLNHECVRELEQSWLPNITDSGLERIIDLLRKDSPLLIHGCFTKAVPMGVAWRRTLPGIILSRNIARSMPAFIVSTTSHLNPATSLIIREWDARGRNNWDLHGFDRSFDRELRQRKMEASSDRTASKCEISAS